MFHEWTARYIITNPFGNPVPHDHFSLLIKFRYAQISFAPVNGLKRY